MLIAVFPVQLRNDSPVYRTLKIKKIRLIVVKNKRKNKRWKEKKKERNGDVIYYKNILLM